MGASYRVAGRRNGYAHIVDGHQLAAYAASVLEGVSLPAQKRELVRYAREQDGGARVVGDLELLPDREYATLDEVAEELAPVQPPRRREEKLPQPESGGLPGAGDYTNPHPVPGHVRDDPGDRPAS